MGFWGKAFGTNAAAIRPSVLASPWRDEASHLPQIIAQDIWGADITRNLPVDRSVAITVPAVSRGRNLLVGGIQRYPLVALDQNGILGDQPTWLQRTDGPVTPQDRVAWTVDDLIFHGVSLWLRSNGAAGQILDAAWHPFADWRITTDGVEARADADSSWILLDEHDYILINSPFDGLLNIAARTIRGALDTEEAWVGRMRNPIPLLNLILEEELEPEEIKQLSQAWSEARTRTNGAVSYTPPGVKLEALGELKPELFTEGRNAVRTDIGSFLNVPTSMMDGSLAEASLTYVTQEGNRSRFNEESIPFWTTPIEARLSMDDVVPRGTRVRFDRREDYALTPTPTGIPTED